MNKFPISLSHPCMYGRDNMRVLGGVVESRTRALLARRMGHASLQKLIKGDVDVDVYVIAGIR